MKKRARRRGFPVKLTKQRWLLVRMAGHYLDNKGQLDDGMRRALALIPDFEPGVSGVRTIRLQGSIVAGMRRLLSAASAFYYRHYRSDARYLSADGQAFKTAADGLGEVDPVTCLGDVARHSAELVNA